MPCKPVPKSEITGNPSKIFQLLPDIFQAFFIAITGKSYDFFPRVVKRH
jgi:hypothetical protein